MWSLRSRLQSNPSFFVIDSALTVNLFGDRVSISVMKHFKTNKGRMATDGAPPTRDRKAMQLCSQVRYALEYAINDVLKGEYGLTVADVVPAPNTSHLLVSVQSFEELSFDQCLQVTSELNNHCNSLRSVVSESIHRRKTPGLSFQIVQK